MSLLFTPSPRKTSYMHPRQPSASTPTRPHHHRRTSSSQIAAAGLEMISSPSFVNLRSPQSRRTSQVPSRSLSEGEGEESSSEDADQDEDEDAGEVEDGDETHHQAVLFKTPATPAPSQSRSTLPLPTLSNVRQRQPHRRISNSNPSLLTPSNAIPAPHFGMPKATPQTPNPPREWKDFDGAESMTRLSLRDLRDRDLTSSREKENNARYFASGSRRRAPSSDFGSPSTSPVHKSARFSPLRLAASGSYRPSLDYKKGSPEPFPPVPTLSRVTSPSPHRQLSISPTDPDLSIPATSAASLSQAQPKALRLSRKFRPKPQRDSGVSGVGTTDESDSGIGDGSFGSSSSLADSNNGANNVTPTVVLNGDDDYNLVTPSLPSSEPSGWPGVFWGEAPSTAGSGTPAGRARRQTVDADELLLHMARTAQTAGTAHGNGKPVMPDTPMKRHPPKQRQWQSTGKDWGLGLPMGSHATNTGTVKGAPRKSMPNRIPNFAVTSPDSPESGSDTSPSKSAFSRPALTSRPRPFETVSGKKMVVANNHVTDDDDEDPRPIPALPLSKLDDAPSSIPLLKRTELLRRSSSGAFSIASSQSSEGSAMGTPTKKSHTPGPTGSLLSATSSSQTLMPTASRVTPAVPASPLHSDGSSSSTTTTGTARRPVLRRGSSATSFTSRKSGFATPAPPPSAFVLPKVVPAAPGPVRAFMNSRPSLHGQSHTPMRPPFRRESNPIHPSDTGISWGGGNHRIPSLFAGSAMGSTAAVRRARSTVAMERAAAEVRGVELVEEDPGRFEREFVRSGDALLGRGTFGQVFRVKAKYGGTLEKTYAVKKSKAYEGDRHRARLLEEVEVLRHLTLCNGALTSTPSTHRTTQGHDNVLHYVGAWEQDRTLYIQTELCELGNLADFLREYGRAYDKLDEPRLWKIAAEIANGLHHIHASGVLHLDMKPANIFVTNEGRLRIGDFGMATRWPRENSSVATLGSGFEREGDREYLAAEILVGKYGPEADIFSFGMIMLEAAGNIVVPSNGDAWHRLRHDDFEEVPLDVFSNTIVSFITRMLMAADPSKRLTIARIQTFEPIARTRAVMKRNRLEVKEDSGKMFRASAFATEPASFLQEVLSKEQDDDLMDLTN
ncbi:hypothetical protein FRB98_000549 [Tulasnella sp. 332]|nr:hypothetical protein FRB98_000549 [Tulasnella sp. 332]